MVVIVNCFFVFLFCCLTAEETPITTASHAVYFFELLEAPITTASHEVYFFGLPEAPITTASHVCHLFFVFLVFHS